MTIQPLNFQQKLFLFFVILRFISEIILVFFEFDTINYIVSGFMLSAIAVFIYPEFMIRKSGSRVAGIVADYRFILLYLGYLILRVSFFDIFSWKLFLSETLVYFFFIYSLENSIKSQEFQRHLRQILHAIFKIIILIGVIQLSYSFLKEKSFLGVWIDRPVRGVFVHPNIYAVLILPLSVYFSLREDYLFSFLAFVTTLGTGTRSPFAVFACCSIIIVKSFFKKKVLKFDIAITIMLISAFFLYLMHYYRLDYIDHRQIERISPNSFIWRMDVWRYLLSEFLNHVNILFGDGLGSSFYRVGKLMGVPGFAPHNDYLKLLYETGLVGLIFYISVLVYMLNKLIRTSKQEVSVLFLMIISFQFVDNYMFYTHAIFSYALIAVSLADRKVLNENSFNK